MSFACHSGKLQYLRMPLELTNVFPGSQRAFDTILSFKWRTCLIYNDDIIIYSKTVEEHIRHFDYISTARGDTYVTLKIIKCRIFSAIIGYIGHNINPRKLEVDIAHTARSQAAAEEDENDVFSRIM